ncbi:Gag-Pol polyprotein [Bienertia sinuspersici]
MQKYLQQVKKEIKTLNYFSITQVPRSDNSQADALSILASSALSDNPRTVFWEVKEKRSIEKDHVMALDRSSTWMNAIWEFKTRGTLPTDPREARKLRRKAEWFDVFKGDLYKRSYCKPYLKCITPEKGHEVLDDLHKGLCSSHIGGRALAEKVMRLGYFWPALRQDAMDMVTKCEKCQNFGPLIHKPATELITIDSPLPFAKWGMDILGPYTPAAGQIRYVFVAVGYFTKWVEAEAVKGIKTKDVTWFIWKSIITRYGIPQSIVFDNGPQLETPHLKKWMSDQGISSCFASVGRPQANGQVEAFNKIISEGVKKKLDRAKGLWADELPNILWSIRTTAKNSTGETPFLLVYGAEAVLPIEMYEPTLRIMLYDEEANWEAMKLALDFLPETRGNAQLRHEMYKLRMTREYNKRVKERPLKPGDFVLRKLEALGRANEQGKLTPNWEGPYKIREEVRNGTYRLETPDGDPLPRT